MRGSDRLPFGAEHKDHLWNGGAWLYGVFSIVLLIWLASGWNLMLFGWRFWAVFLILGFLLSMRSATAWRRGEAKPSPTETREPTVEVIGKEGSTYVVLPNGGGRRSVRPRELEPRPWALYSLVKRLPVAAGDVTLTILWRAFWKLFSIDRTPRIPIRDETDYLADHPRPDSDTF